MDLSSQCDNGHEYRYKPLLTTLINVKANLESHFIHVPVAKPPSQTKEFNSSLHPEDSQFTGQRQKPHTQTSLALGLSLFKVSVICKG